MVDNKKPLPDLDYLHDILDYDPETGIFIWRTRPDRNSTWNTRYAGKVAGCVHRGYKVVRIDGYGYSSARVAWMYVYGYDPNVVDYKNNTPGDDRIRNLRDATDGEVIRNQRQHSKQKYGKGIHRGKTGFIVHITLNRKLYHVGVFDNVDDAKLAYNKAAIMFFGEFAKLNPLSETGQPTLRKVRMRNAVTGRYSSRISKAERKLAT